MTLRRAFSCHRSITKAGAILTGTLLCAASVCTLIASDARTGDGDQPYGFLALDGSSGPTTAPAQTEEVVSVTLNPATIAGGSGGTSTGTVTLNIPAPTGGAVVTLSSSNVELAATMPRVTVPAGATTATFTVATNARYRAYSGLSFSVAISATRLTTRSATLTVTAQPRPADFNSGSTAGANTQWDGLMCGGIAPIGGQQGILYSCSPADASGFGTCTFRQECSLGCRRVPPNGGTFNDVCATSGPNPVAISRNYFTSGDHVAATLRTEAPVTVPTTAVPVVINTDANARSFSPDDVGGIHFPTGVGATSVPFDVATSYVPTIQFVDVGGFWFDDDIPPLLITSGRGGQVWAAMVPPDPPPAQPIPTPVQFKIVGLNPVTGGQSSIGQVHTSGIPHGIGPTITFTSSHPGIVPAPASVTPPASNLLGFDVNLPTQPPAADTDVTLTATDGRYTYSGVLTVRVPPPAPVLADLTINPTSVPGGASATGTVVLSAPQSGPTVVKVSIIDSAPATLPTNAPPCPPSSRCHNVTVPAGATSASFTINTSAVTSQFNLNIFADLPGSPGQSALLLITPGGPTTARTLTISPPDVVGTISTTGVVTLTGAAPSGGAVVTLSKALSNGGAGTVPVTIPSSVTVPAGQTSASFAIATGSVTATTSVRISAAFNGVTVNADMTLFTNLQQVSFAPSNVVGGTTTIGTVTLGAPAPSGGAVIALSSSNTTLATVPASVTVPAGQTSATFTANTSAVTATTPVDVSASYGGVTVTGRMFLLVSRAVSSVTLTPSSVVGGTSSTGRVTLRAAAPTGHALVSLASSNTTLAVVPGTVTVVSGQTSATFTVNTGSVTATATVVISASYENVTESATLTINPSGSGGGGGGAAGFLSPTANAPDSGGDGNGFESSPASAHGDDTAVATDTNSGSGTSTSCTNSGKDRHRFYNFGFAVPDGAAIAGLEVRLDARADSTSGSPRLCVQLSWDGGATWTAAKATTTLGTSLSTFTLGGAADTWGRTWSAANLTDASFRLRVINVAGSTARDFFLDWVAVRLHAATAGPAALRAVSLSPTTVVEGAGLTGTVTLSSGAPTGGAVVTLSSSNTTVVNAPASVTIAAGATSATFTATTSAVGVSTPVTIAAAYNGVNRTATLTVNPPSQTTSATLTVTATGRSGERVTSSPAGISVNVGSTGLASFNPGTSITLSVASGRDATWSGACSSGGSKRRSCTFTLNGTASVAANVQ